jgi:hypothetical protein
VSSRTSAPIPLFHARLIHVMELGWIERRYLATEAKSPEKVFYTPVLLLETVYIERSGMINTDSFSPKMADFHAASLSPCTLHT